MRRAENGERSAPLCVHVRGEQLDQLRGDPRANLRPRGTTHGGKTRAAERYGMALGPLLDCTEDRLSELETRSCEQHVG